MMLHRLIRYIQHRLYLIAREMCERPDREM